MDDANKPSFATGGRGIPTKPVDDEKPPEPPAAPPEEKEAPKANQAPRGPRELSDEERLDYMIRFFVTDSRGTAILTIPGCPPVQAKTPREAIDKAVHTFRNR